MIKQKSSLDKLPLQMRPAFQELGVLKHLRNSGFKKTFGYTCSQGAFIQREYCVRCSLIDQKISNA